MWERIGFNSGIIRLNPDGRAQTKKYRPEVRVGPAVIEVLLKAHAKRQGEHGIMFRGKHVHRLDTGWEVARKGLAEASRVTLYSLRHTVALRPHDPNYLRKSVDFLDELISFCVRA